MEGGAMTVFSGVDVVIDRQVGEDEIRESLAHVLPIDAARISVIDDVAKYPERTAADIVCITTSSAGEFAQVLSIQCEPVELPGRSTADVLQQLATTLNAKLLMPDEGDDPYVMWLLQPRLAPRRVALDEAALDEDRYEIREPLDM
jgi:hypothetical protein